MTHPSRGALGYKAERMDMEIEAGEYNERSDFIKVAVRLHIKYLEETRVGEETTDGSAAAPSDAVLTDFSKEKGSSSLNGLR